MVGNVVSDGTGGIKFEVSKAVLGGMRMAALKDTVKRLLRVFRASEAEIAAINQVFAQLGDIQFLRDRLAHHWTRPTEEDGSWRNDDFVNVRELSKLTPACLELYEPLTLLSQVYNCPLMS